MRDLETGRFVAQKRITKICSFCKIKFECLPKNNRKFCSTTCYRQSIIGKKRPLWIGEKISKAKKGKVVISEEQKRQISKTLKNRKLSVETRKKMSLNRRGKPFPNPPTLEQHKSIKWRKNISKGLKKYFLETYGQKRISSKEHRIRESMEYGIWRKEVFSRDNWTCQKCKKLGGLLHSHHILNFLKHDNLRLAIDNGITFCVGCHKEFHKKYGKRNNNMEQIKEFVVLKK